MDFRTQILRVTLMQEVREFFVAQQWCRVQVVIPASPIVYIDEDIKVGFEGTQNIDPIEGETSQIGPDRTYKMPEMQPGARYDFRLAPGQNLVGAVKQGKAHFAIIVEPCRGPADWEGRS